TMAVRHRGLEAVKPMQKEAAAPRERARPLQFSFPVRQFGADSFHYRTVIDVALMLVSTPLGIRTDAKIGLIPTQAPLAPHRSPIETNHTGTCSCEVVSHSGIQGA